MTTQWGMMREQLRSLTTDLAKAQVEIEYHGHYGRKTWTDYGCCQ